MSIAAWMALSMLAAAGAQAQDEQATTRPATEEPTTQPAAGNEARESKSDPEAVALARQVVERMGGRKAFDQTRFLAFEFFGFRHLAWDRATNRVRVEGRSRGGEAYVVLFDLDDGKGRAWKDGVEVTDTVELDEQIRGGMSAWINDFYWLLMPYKLEDPGVTIRMVGAKDMADGNPADVIEVTFDAVGLTPNNKYHVYVARESGLVEQWDFFLEASDAEPRMSTPWLDWKPFGKHGILLSGNRGQRKLSDIAAPESMPDAVFDSPEPVDWASFVN